MKISIVVLSCDQPTSRIDNLTRLLEYINSHNDHIGELIVCDNSVGDGVKKLIETRKFLFPVSLHRIKYKPYNLSVVRNIGIEQAVHEIICFFNCDVLPVCNDFFDKVVLWHNRNDNLLLIHGTHIEGKWTKLIEKNGKSFIKDEWRENIVSEGKDLWQIACGGNCSIRVKTISRTRYDDRYAGHWGWEDRDFARQLENKGVRIEFDPSIAAIHQTHEIDVEKRKLDRSFNEKKFLEKWGE